jgi:hypothetical protein
MCQIYSGGKMPLPKDVIFHHFNYAHPGHQDKEKGKELADQLK